MYYFVKNKMVVFLTLIPIFFHGSELFGCSQPIEHVTIAILAKDKAHTLPLYLRCLEQQTWPAEQSYLYIRTNNNTDDTVRILREWVEKVGDRYAGIYFDDSDVAEQVQQYKQHEWNYERFKVLGAIRQASVQWAQQHQSHYFVVDCDNFIASDTLEELLKTNLPIVAPLLKTGDSLYSNYHAAINADGYYADCPIYNMLWNGEIKGLVQVPVVHCTYLIRHEALDKITYDDASCRYEYVIFSDSARNAGIPQYIDTRKVYGRISFAETMQALQSEPWIAEFAAL